VNDHSPNNTWIGKRTTPPDGVDKVTGRAAFGADFKQPGMLWGKFLSSPHAHAYIKSINTAKAASLPGVRSPRRNCRTSNSNQR